MPMNSLNAMLGLRSLHKVSENMRLAAFPILSLFSNYPNQGKKYLENSSQWND